MADEYGDILPDGTAVTSWVGANDAAVYFAPLDGSRPRTRVPLPAEGNSVRGAIGDDGVRRAIVAGQNDRAYIVTEFMTRAEDAIDVGPCYGRQAVAMLGNRDAIVVSQTEWKANGDVKPLPVDQIGTSIGILDLNADGSPQWTAENDAPREIELAIGLHPRVRLRYWVARAHPSGVANGNVYLGLLLGGHEDQVVLVDRDGPHTLHRGIAYEPHLTLLLDGTIGACWRPLRGRAQFMKGPGWPAFVGPQAPAEPVLPPVDTVPVMGRPFGFIVYTFNNAECPGNIELPIRPAHGRRFDKPIVLPSDRPDLALGAGNQNEVWAVYAGEGPHGNPSAENTIPAARGLAKTLMLDRGVLGYQDSFPLRMSVLDALEPPDVVSYVCKRGPTETLTAFIMRCGHAYETTVPDLNGTEECYPTLNLAQETPARAVETFIAFAQLAKDLRMPGVKLFAWGRPDVPAELHPYLQKFTAGIPSAPASRTLTPKPEVPVPASLKTEIADERKLYGSLERDFDGLPKSKLSADECVELLNNVAKRAGDRWGLLKKESGNFGTRPDGARCSVDHLTYRTGERVNGIEYVRGADVLGDAGHNTAGPGIANPGDAGGILTGEEFEIDRFVEPIDVYGRGAGQQPNPGNGGGNQTPGTPTTGDVAKVLDEIRELRSEVAGLTVLLGNDLRAISERIDELARKVGGDYIGETRAELPAIPPFSPKPIPVVVRTTLTPKK